VVGFSSGSKGEVPVKNLVIRGAGGEKEEDGTCNC
jgi:hypothetical protein